MRLLGDEPLSEDELIAAIRRPVSSTDDAVALTKFASRYLPIVEDEILKETRSWISPDLLGRATGLAIDLAIERMRHGEIGPASPLHQQVSEAARTVAEELRRTRRLPSLQTLS